MVCLLLFLRRSDAIHVQHACPSAIACPCVRSTGWYTLYDSLTCSLKSREKVIRQKVVSGYIFFLRSHTLACVHGKHLASVHVNGRGRRKKRDRRTDSVLRRQRPFSNRSYLFIPLGSRSRYRDAARCQTHRCTAASDSPMQRGVRPTDGDAAQRGDRCPWSRLPAYPVPMRDADGSEVRWRETEMHREEALTVDRGVIETR